MSKYIDTAGGLTRVGGNMALYKKLLGKFKDGNYRERLDELLRAGNKEEAMAMAHTLKGVAANLSLTEVNSLALQIESALKNEGAWDELLARLAEASDATLREIEEL
ncbi:MAG: Hpt domain-containing protein [Oscillospiraceae bacterium]|jgi:two-component system sensor histidine kinase/response regulator|nr:Hpt domain-containing protein [Oscillospiraceae bacterium]